MIRKMFTSKKYQKLCSKLDKYLIKLNLKICSKFYSKLSLFFTFSLYLEVTSISILFNLKTS
jgi:hypothetical protein